MKNPERGMEQYANWSNPKKEKENNNLSIQAANETRFFPEIHAQNEDTSEIINMAPHERIYVMADGVSDGGGGEVASHNAMRGIKSELDKNPQAEVRDLLGAAQDKVRGEKEGDTTLNILKITGNNNEMRAEYANVGDSKTYLWRSGKLEQLSSDDDMLKILLESETTRKRWTQNGEISPRLGAHVDDLMTMNEESRDKQVKKLRDDVANFPQVAGEVDPEVVKDLYRKRNVISETLTRIDTTQVAYGTKELQGGDSLLLCSDGISDNLTQQEIAQVMREGKNAKETAKMLVDLAYARAMQGKEKHVRAKKDDMTALVVEINGEKVEKQVAQEQIQNEAGQKMDYATQIASIKSIDELINYAQEMGGIRKGDRWQMPEQIRDILHRAEEVQKQSGDPEAILSELVSKQMKQKAQELLTKQTNKVETSEDLMIQVNKITDIESLYKLLEVQQEVRSSKESFTGKEYKQIVNAVWNNLLQNGDVNVLNKITSNHGIRAKVNELYIQQKQVKPKQSRWKTFFGGHRG